MPENAYEAPKEGKEPKRFGLRALLLLLAATLVAISATIWMNVAPWGRYPFLVLFGVGFVLYFVAILCLRQAARAFLGMPRT